jgi:histidinol-phosphate aminotransferase
MGKLFKLENLLRENIKNIVPYSSARDEYKGSEGVFLDANENPHGSTTNPAYNRYPDPLQWKLKERIATIKKIDSSMIMLGNGSDEPIDLLFRAFCKPGIDNVIVMPPTYGMYQVAADINDVQTRKVNLTEDFHLDTPQILATVDENTKLIFVCSPNNPSGNALRISDIIDLIENFDGIVVVDEAYIDFAPNVSFVPYLTKYPNLVILQTFSKAWGMAGLRVGMAFASENIVKIFNNIKYPYNINSCSQAVVLEGLKGILQKEKMVEDILNERERLREVLMELSCVKLVYPSDANFLLVKVVDANALYKYLIDKKIITRNRTNVVLCENCLRISVGTEIENNALLSEMKNFKNI